MNDHNNLPKLTADDAMNAAIRWLEGKRINYHRPSAFHLKMGPVNFWPKTGSITVDGEMAKRPAKGLDALKAVLVSVCIVRDRL
jgi:hypothetical protein